MPDPLIRTSIAVAMLLFWPGCPIPPPFTTSALEGVGGVVPVVIVSGPVIFSMAGVVVPVGARKTSPDVTRLVPLTVYSVPASRLKGGPVTEGVREICAFALLATMMAGGAMV